MNDIIPGIYEKTLTEINDKIIIAAPHAPWLHIDIADMTLVENESFRDFSVWKNMPEPVSFEAHLMVVDPVKYIRPLADAGFKRLIAHVESQDPRRFIEEAHYEDNIEVGLAIDGPTEFEQIEPFLEELDVVLVMTIEAGFSGQPFLPETVEKIKLIHQNVPDLIVQVDGGINDQTAKICKEAGASRFVSTSYLFSNKSQFAEKLEGLRDL
jgi:ribulose-phosphate 3-epimerase